MAMRPKLHLLNPRSGEDREMESSGGAPAPPRSWDEVRVLPPPTFMVENLLVSGGLSLLTGQPKAGKSTVAATLVAAVAGFGPKRFFHREVLEHGNVLIHAPDEMTPVTVDRFRSLGTPDGAPVYFTDDPFMDVKNFARLVRSGDYRMAVVDTLGRMCAGPLSGNGDPYYIWLKQFQIIRAAAVDSDCHIVLLHHAGKDAKNQKDQRGLDALGSVAITGSVDTIMSATAEVQKDKAPIRRIISTNRLGEEIPPTRTWMDRSGWVRCDPPVKVAPKPLGGPVLEALRSSGLWMSRSELVEVTGLSEATVRRQLNVPVAAGEVERRVVETGAGGSRREEYRWA